MNRLYKSVCDRIREHCQDKGYREVPGVNNFIPHDAIAAFGMAKLLAGKFDRYVAVAPHIYGYLEQLGIQVLSIFTDYPPTRCESQDDLSVLSGRKVLLIEDDVISGKSLQLVIEHLQRFKPASLALYLGHNIGIQHLGNVPEEIRQENIYIAERTLTFDQWHELETEFTAFFKTKVSSHDTSEIG